MIHKNLCLQITPYNSECNKTNLRQILNTSDFTK